MTLIEIFLILWLAYGVVIGAAKVWAYIVQTKALKEEEAILQAELEGLRKGLLS